LNWSEKHKSSGAKEVLIKSVAPTIPTYVMGIFKLSAGLCEELAQLIKKLWWGEEGNQRKLHWIVWEKLILPKCRGGMGFRDMKQFNQTLLARQAWWLIQFPDSLCSRLLKAKCFPNSELVDTAFPTDTSPTWKPIEHGLELVKKGIISRIGSGARVQIW
jgi:hypothetical protein